MFRHAGKRVSEIVFLKKVQYLMGKGKTYSESKKVHGVELWGWLKVAYLALLLSRRVHVSLAKWAEDLVSVELTAWLGPT